MNGKQRNTIAKLRSAILEYLAPNLKFVDFDIKEMGSAPNATVEVKVNFKTHYGTLFIKHTGTMKDVNERSLKECGHIARLPPLTKIVKKARRKK